VHTFALCCLEALALLLSPAIWELTTPNSIPPFDALFFSHLSQALIFMTYFYSPSCYPTFLFASFGHLHVRPPIFSWADTDLETKKKNTIAQQGMLVLGTAPR
jgi:hypothetical protein